MFLIYLNTSRYDLRVFHFFLIRLIACNTISERASDYVFSIVTARRGTLTRGTSRHISRSVARHRADEALKSRISLKSLRNPASRREPSVNTRPRPCGTLHLLTPPWELDIPVQKNRRSAPRVIFTAASSRRKNNCYYVVSTAPIYLYRGYRLSFRVSERSSPTVRIKALIDSLSTMEKKE